ncbi:MAG: RluA family pseudouridine synthase [Planctomycetota bacterium]
MSLRVLFADNHLLAVHKPAGLPTVPDDSGDESLFERARRWVEVEFQKPGRAFLGVVHRLDRPVSGVVLFARTSKAAARLTAAFAERRVRKTYVGVAVGALAAPEGEVEQWLWKDRDRNRVHVRPGPEGGAKRARTRWRVLATGQGFPARALVELRPETGRPHQLRVAMASLGAPLAGDLRYGAAEALPDRSIALHAARLALEHPVRREPLELAAPRPTVSVWRFPEETGTPL